LVRHDPRLVCGFAGELRVHGRADVAAVDRMAAACDRRGPDGAGLWAQDGVALGHRRLSIIDLSAAGAQPMSDPGLGLTIAFNGCVYNYPELIEELRRDGYHFTGHSDTEVILKAWHRWGEGALERLHGMFAFAIHERDTGRLVLARDRLGIKPLYYAETQGALRFASTLPALLAGGGVDTEIDRVALHHYLSWHAVVPAPRTILQGVRKVAPATVVTIEPDGRRRERRWWSPDWVEHPELDHVDADGWATLVLEALRRAVRKRMVSDVPVGVLLSGGLDSSLIVALLAEEGQRDLRTFSVGFEDVGGMEGDEFRWSDRVAREFGTEHHQLRVPDGELFAALGGAIDAMSEPMTSHDVVAFYLLSREVSQHVKVVQSGQGADEVLGGYAWYPPLLDAEGLGDDAYATAFFDRTHAELNALLGDGFRLGEDPSRALVHEHFARDGAARPVKRALRLDTEVMLVDDPVKRVDNMTMAWGLEARTPFLDHEFVELAARCPPELKLAQDGKGVLKDAGRRVLPVEVVDREKGYFPVPALRELRGPYVDLVRDALLDPAARRRGIFDTHAVERLLADPNATMSNLGPNALWQVALLELWLQARGV
jgi:asparagine synthase (glutamine-hydrolysing)